MWRASMRNTWWWSSQQGAAAACAWSLKGMWSKENLHSGSNSESLLLHKRKHLLLTCTNIWGASVNTLTEISINIAMWNLNVCECSAVSLLKGNLASSCDKEPHTEKQEHNCLHCFFIDYRQTGRVSVASEFPAASTKKKLFFFFFSKWGKNIRTGIVFQYWHEVVIYISRSHGAMQIF